MYNLIVIFLALFNIIILFHCIKGNMNKAILYCFSSLFIIPFTIQSIQIPGLGAGFPIQYLPFLIVTISFLLNKGERKRVILLTRKYRYILIIYIFCSVFIILNSEKVPIKMQTSYFIAEIVQILFIIIVLSQSYKDLTLYSRLIRCIKIMLIFNFIYSITFEMILHFNPAGNMLYSMLGLNDAFTDMINSERGAFSMRIQSIFGHPLSLGQYYLLLTPIFLANKKGNWIYATCLFFFIVLSGTRGALFPFIIIITIFAINKMNKQSTNLFKYILATGCLFVVIYAFLPLKYQIRTDNIYDTIVSNITFWKESNHTTGSTMDMRTNQLDAAFYEIRNDILFGEGKGYREFYSIQNGHVHPDLLGFESLILLKLTEEGIIGLILYIILILCLYSFFWSHSNYKILTTLLYLAFFLSTIMTGIRPYSLLILGLSSIILTSNRNPYEDTSRIRFNK